MDFRNARYGNGFPNMSAILSSWRIPLFPREEVGGKSCFVHSVEQVIRLMAHPLLFVTRYA